MSELSALGRSELERFIAQLVESSITHGGTCTDFRPEGRRRIQPALLMLPPIGMPRAGTPEYLALWQPGHCGSFA
jgi:hypothetical protein